MNKISTSFILFFAGLLFFSMLWAEAYSQVSFAPYFSYPMGSNPQKVAIADLNNDGLNDVVVGTSYYFDAVNDYSIFIYHQNSSGTLDAPVQYKYPVSYPGIRGMATGDVNNDGLTDIVVGYGDSIGIFYQQAGGAFGGYKSFYSGNTVDGISIGDLNNDGKNDIVVCHWNAAYIRVFTQGTAGALTSVTYTSTQEGYDQVNIADINNDGLNDVVFMSGQGFGGIHIFTQTVSGTLNAQVTYPNSMNNHGMGIGDLNNDGRMDIAASGSTTNANSQIDIWYQDSTTHLLKSPPLVLSSYDLPEAVAVAGLTCDGKNQIVAANAGWGNVSVFSQDGSGNYSSYQKFGISGASHFMPGSMAVGDINNDGRKDIVVVSFYPPGSDNGLLVLLNNSDTGGIASVNIAASVNTICSGTPVTFTATAVATGSSPSYNWTVNGINQGINGAVLTTDSLKLGKDTVKCIMISSAACVKGSPATSNPVIISVGSGGNAGIVSALRDTICEGTPGHLNAAGNSGGQLQWQSTTSPGTPASFTIITGATSSSYTTEPLSQTTSYRLIAGSGNCADTSNVYKLLVVPSPLLSFTNVATGLSLTFTSIDSLQTVDRYSWNFGDSITSTDKNPAHTYASKGTYYVCLTGYNGSNCSYTFCNYIEVGANGIASVSTGNGWKIYPNPFNNYLVIQNTNSKNTPLSVSVYDVLGRKVIDKAIVGSESRQDISIDVSTLAQGLYYVELKMNDENFISSIVKQK